jgi:hypothetical protein
MTGSLPQPRPPEDARSWMTACFDPALATAPTRVVRVDAVVDLLEVTHLPERIIEYRQAMERGARFPPIAVVRVAGRFLVADGHKRLSAYKALPVDEIVVEVWTMRRWLHDQWRQLVHKTRQQWWLLWRSPVDRQARAQARRLFWDTVGHWKRVVSSLSRVWQRRRPE